MSGEATGHNVQMGGSDSDVATAPATRIGAPLRLDTAGLGVDGESAEAECATDGDGMATATKEPSESTGEEDGIGHRCDFCVIL